MLYPVKGHLKYQESYSPRSTRDTECQRNTVSFKHQMISSRQGRFLKQE